MKSLICYFSTTGNTKLACEYLARRIPEAGFELMDIARDPLPDLEPYRLVGLAAFADFVGPPKLMRDFIGRIPPQRGKAAFVFNTYGNFNGATLRVLARLARARGFQVLAGHALNTPENFPPLIAGGMANADYPSERQLAEFDRFSEDLRGIAGSLKEGRPPRAAAIQLGLPERMMPPLPRVVARYAMGRKRVDPSLCNQCGICQSVCPYRAVTLNPGPVFDQKKCYGCWSCYNHCPSGAIYTKMLRGKGQYPEPHDRLRAKLGE